MIPSTILIREFPTATPNERIGKVIEKMREYKIYTIPVVDSKGRLVGIVTYKDLLERRVSPMAKVKAVMSGPHKIPEDADILEIAKRFYFVRVKTLPVVDSDNRVIALASRELFARYLVENDYVPNLRVIELASCPAITANVDDPVAKVKWEMLRRGISRVPILDDGKLVGIVTMRDIVEKLYYASIAERATVGEFAGTEDEILAAPVKAIMSYPVITAEEYERVLRVVERLIERGISGLPVMSEGKVVGVFSGLDVIKRYLQGQKVEIPITASIEIDLPEDQHRLVEKILSNYYGKLTRITDIIDLKLNVKVYECEEEEEGKEKRCKYSVHILLKDPHDTYTVNVVEWDPVKAIRDAFHLIYRNVLKNIRKLREKKRRKIKGVGPEELGGE